MTFFWFRIRINKTNNCIKDYKRNYGREWWRWLCVESEIEIEIVHECVSHDLIVETGIEYQTPGPDSVGDLIENSCARPTIFESKIYVAWATLPFSNCNPWFDSTKGVMVTLEFSYSLANSHFHSHQIHPSIAFYRVSTKNSAQQFTMSWLSHVNYIN